MELSKDKVNLLRTVVGMSSHSIKLLDNILATLNLTFFQWMILDTLASQESMMTLKDISLKTGIAQTVVTRLLVQLENRSFVARHFNGTDKRISYVLTTEQGKRNCQLGYQNVNAFTHVLTHYLDEAEVLVSKTALSKMKDQLNDYYLNKRKE